MITETEARELLARAAETIEVPPSAPLVLAPPKRPRWIAPVAAAAAIAAAVGAGVVLVHHQDRPDQPGPVAPTPTLDPYAGHIPPVFSYDGTAAQRMLENRGLVVGRKVVTNHCEAPGRALRTVPDVGFPVSPGDRITLYVSGPLVNACNPPTLLAWRILDFANGRGPEPSLAEGAEFYVNGERSSLATIAEFLVRRNASLLNAGTPVLQARYLKSPQPCSYFDSDGKQVNPPFPQKFVGRRSYWMDVVVPMDGIDFTCHSTNVFVNADGAIDAIVVDASPFLLEPSKPAPTRVPDRRFLPAPAAHFINFAKGWMKHPGFADIVKLYNDGSLVRSMDRHRAQDASAYGLCPGSAHPDQCGLSPIQLIRQLSKAPTVSERADCFDSTAILPHRSGHGTLLITDAQVPPCESSWVVQLEYNARNEIVAINEFEGPK